MVNKVRKKDGTMKYPYQYVVPFVKVIEMKNRIKQTAKYAYTDNKSYGTYLWGNAGGFTEMDAIEAIIKEYIPEYKAYPRRDGWYGFSFYVAYKEHDVEV